jgi:hypothetical protein
VAKGNNGNLLQHFVESELAAFLTESQIEKRLHAVFTHGMAPFERCEPLRPDEPGELRALLEALPSLDERWAIESGYPVIQAYKRLGATTDRYPNSAEVVAAALGGKTALRGEICERDESRAEELARTWGVSGVNVRTGSWRDAVRHISCPQGQESPWIFTMDPYRFHPREFMDVQDDGDLDQHDLVALKPVIAGHFNSAQPGVAVIFSYKMEPSDALAFENAIHDFCVMLGGAVNFEVSNIFLPTPAAGAAEHVAALIAEDAKLLERVKSRWAGCLDAIRAVI